MPNTDKVKNTNSAESEKKYQLDINDDNIERIDRIIGEYYNRIMMNLDNQYLHQTKKSDLMADSIASFVGSWRFIVIFAACLIVWILVNTLPLFTSHFDPMPFILLNLCLSFIAAFQAPLIMMSQNRQAARDKHESVIDFAINYKAEQEIDDIQAHLHSIETEIAEMKKMLVGLCEKK